MIPDPTNMFAMAALVTRGVLGLVVLYMIWRLFRVSLVYISNTDYGIVERKWAMPWCRGEGSLIALNGQAGFLPEVIRGGWHVFFPFQYHVWKQPLIQIDQIAYLVARIGQPLAEGQALGQWPLRDPLLLGSGYVDVEDARAFLTQGGQAGPQRQILRPKTYAINTALFCVITGGQILNIEGEKSKEDQQLQQLLINRRAFDPVIIDNDNIGVITVQDGPSLTHGEIVARSVGTDMMQPATFHNSFQDIPRFLAAGGQRGRQEQVIVEGTYFINRLFATVEVMPKTKIGIGTVGVVNSYVGPEEVEALTAEQGRGRTVDKGKRGIQSLPLEPGKYALNPYAVEVTVVPTTNFQLSWDANVVSKLKDARAEANRVSYDDDLKEVRVITKDAFEILLPITVVAHISPTNAAHVIQRFSQVSRFVNQTLDPLVSSFFRDAAQKTDLLAFVQNRSELGKQALEQIKTRMLQHKIDIEEVLIDAPREVHGSNAMERLFDQLRDRQTAKEQKTTFEAQGNAADALRILNEKQAIAGQQAALTASHISVSVAENEGQADSSRRAKAAEGVRVTADADAYAVKAKADAQAHANEVAVASLGGHENFLRQFSTTKLAEAIMGAAVPLVPATQLSLGTQAESLIGQLVKMAGSTSEVG